MSDLVRRSGTRMTRRQREDRIYHLTMGAMGAGAMTVILFVLAFVLGVTLLAPITTGVVTGALAVEAKRTLTK
jgi:fatty acid desaturase